MNEKQLHEIINPEPAIKVTRSMINRGKIAKKGHAFFVVTSKIKSGVATLVQEIKTEGMSPITELALKGTLVNEFKEHFKI